MPTSFRSNLTEGLRWAFLICLFVAALAYSLQPYFYPPESKPPTIVTGYVLMQQYGNNPPRMVPDPKSKSFPSDVIAFTGEHGRWACQWNAAVRTMLDEQAGSKVKYSCSLNDKIRVHAN